ncbi:MAG: PASTA domain-containing protein [Firmicutes bacterium]|nr:PASTA domain-containing protein [Bacillota bacterium]
MKISGTITKRSFVVLGVFVVLWILICVVLFNLQITSYDYYQEQVVTQLTKETTVTATRGVIYDTNMNLLAGNKTVYLIFISPQDIIDSSTDADYVFTGADAEAIEKDTLGMKSYVSEGTNVYTYTDADGEVSSYTMNKLIAHGLSDILGEEYGVEYSKVLKLAAKENRYYEVIAKSVEKTYADRVREFIDEYDLDEQIYLTASSERYYPNGTLASHVLGFLNSDGDGVYGLEAYYNDILEGTSGTYVTARDGTGSDMPYTYETYVEEEDGYSIVTTIDSYIQYELEAVLEETLTDNAAANRVCGIVMDVNTGAILAMATLGSYDPNDPYTLTEYYETILESYGYDESSDEYTDAYYDLLYTMWTNKAVTELYEPGSTFKVVTSAIALELGTVSLSDSFYCPGSITVSGYSSAISCHKTAGHGSLSFAEALQQSCNVAFVKIGQGIGREAFYNYFMMFGYGSTTGIDLPSESASYYHSYENFTDVSLAVYSFGQTFKTTPIQQITAIAAVANGGYLVTPHLLSEVLDSDGNVIETYDTSTKRQIISEETCATLAEILEDGVSGNGGAKNTYVAGYKVAAKTGTSQKRDKLDENGEDTLRVGSCIAFAPSDDASIAALIMVDEPMENSVYGSVVAAPYVSELLSVILPYLGYEPQYTEDEAASIETTIANYVNLTESAAVALLEKNNINYVVVGNGSTVVAQSPAAGTVVSELSKFVVLYMSDDAAETEKQTVTVPDVTGMSATEATAAIINANLNIRISGAANYTSSTGATVVSQSIEGGTLVEEGTVVTLTMMHLTDITD